MRVGSRLLFFVAAAQAQRFDPSAQRYQEELLRQQQYQRQQQQQQQQYAQATRQAQQQEQIRQLQREAMLQQAQQAAAYNKGGGAGYPGQSGMYGGSKPPLSKKEQKELKKKQERDAKTVKELQKANTKLRQQDAKMRQQAASKRYAGSRRAAVQPKRGGLAGFVLSWKGVVALGGVAYLYVAQRELLVGKLLKYPLWFVSWLFRCVWVMALKPVVRFVVLRGKGGGELPGGSY